MAKETRGEMGRLHVNLQDHQQRENHKIIRLEGEKKKERKKGQVISRSWSDDVVVGNYATSSKLSFYIRGCVPAQASMCARPGLVGGEGAGAGVPNANKPSGSSWRRNFRSWAFSAMAISKVMMERQRRNPTVLDQGTTRPISSKLSGDDISLKPDHPIYKRTEIGQARVANQQHVHPGNKHHAPASLPFRKAT